MVATSLSGAAIAPFVGAFAGLPGWWLMTFARVAAFLGAISGAVARCTPQPSQSCQVGLAGPFPTPAGAVVTPYTVNGEYALIGGHIAYAPDDLAFLSAGGAR